MLVKTSRILTLSTGVVGIVLTMGILCGCEDEATASDTVKAVDNASVQPMSQDERMGWWREARFGMFIHWGLYAVPAGEWNGNKDHAEWIRTTAQIPIEQYDKFVDQFNPVNFDAEKWVLMAKRAGMKYIVITSKHHDGFCLWDSKQTEYDIMSTPFKRDILAELTAACKKHGVRMCFYHSIMDWHHPDYLPRRGWEKNRSAEGADYGAYVSYMKKQLSELVTGYDPGVLWFDGEWEGTWTHDMGKDLYDYMRGLKSDIIVNNRVDKGRQGMQGLTAEGDYRGDFGTPEQEIPDQGIPGMDWESCMTMNNHWGWNKNDKNFKSTEDLVRKLIDIASKGGNYLLNIGPKADGTFPQESIERLEQMGQWMDAYGDSIYGTQASPFDKPSWGRCTQKKLANGNTRLYLHIFDWPKNGKLTVPGLASKPVRASLMGTDKALETESGGTFVAVSVPEEMPNKIATVVILDIKGEPKVVKVNPYADETPEQRDARMKWWRESRFGMFIHWGVYSVPAGTYDGKRIGGIGEWIMNRGKIPVERYKKYAQEFNPVKYDPDEWVRLAKEAGMKYIVITSKHHDGFALFDSKVTDWDIVDATPYGKDLLKPLAEACKRHGIKLGFYYSQAQDWCHPGGAAAGGHWDKAQDGDMDKYIREIAMPQVREILSNYGKLGVLWWDTPTGMTKERAEMLLPLINLQPGIIINNRLGGGYDGDLSTPEQHIPATGMPGKDWETCMTMNDTWGYKSYDDHWKSTEDLLHKLAEIASKGGNFLLNVGPTSEGLIPDESVERLKAVGAWMARNGESIYGTTASPLGALPFGRCTAKPGKIYLHVLNWPNDGKLVVKQLKNEVTKASLLADGTELKVGRDGRIITVDVPKEAPDPINTVVVLNIVGEPDVVNIQAIQEEDGSVLLPASVAKVDGGNARYESGGAKDNIGYWTNAKDTVQWTFSIDRPGTFEIQVMQACESSGGTYVVDVAGQQVDATLKGTGNWDSYTTEKIGKVKLDAAGEYTLKVIPRKMVGIAVMNLRNVKLVPVR